MKISPSSGHEQLSGKKIVRFLQPVCQVMGLTVPDLFNYCGLAVFYLIYSSLICILLFALCIYSLYFKVLHFYGNIILTAAILDAITAVGTTATTTVSILLAVVFQRRKIVKVFKDLMEIERMLNEKFECTCKLEDKGLLIQFGCLEFIILSYTIFESAFRIQTHGLFRYTWSVDRYLNLFMISLIVMQVQFISTVIKQYFGFVNDKNSNGKYGAVKTKFFLKIYDRLCDVIDLTSKSHGIQIAAISFIIIICLIQSMNLLMKFALGIDISTSGWNIGFLIADTMNSVIFIMFGVIVAICCEQASNEANNTSIICYKILLNYPSYPKSHDEDITRNELMLLAEHLSQRKIKFSAAGLFVVDHTMLYMIFGSIAAYLVIVLQFK
ncbi:uncharacterized protein LOC135129443 [Zophobas morio]|uniref:uncharacterized protein LOC135129443 n=1 Tax=Zophobas morio TaxID=2755281 RepID=UPI0030831812